MKLLLASHRPLAVGDVFSAGLVEELRARNHRVDFVVPEMAAGAMQDSANVHRSPEPPAGLHRWLSLLAPAYDGALIIESQDPWTAAVTAGLRTWLPTVVEADLGATPRPSVHPCGLPVRRELLVIDAATANQNLVGAVEAHARRRGYTVLDTDEFRCDGVTAVVVAGPIRSWDHVFEALGQGIPLLVAADQAELVALVESERCGLILSRCTTVSVHGRARRRRQWLSGPTRPVSNAFSSRTVPKDNRRRVYASTRRWRPACSSSSMIRWTC
jgi:hypothetical protein